MIEIIPNFHPVVVHFPIALTIVAFATALASQLFKKRVFANQLATVSHYLLWLAAATALVSVAFGWLAYNSVNHDDAGHAAMTVHKFWAFITATVLVLLALFDFKKHQSNTVMPVYFVCLLVLASALVGGTAWLGGEVVYRHGIGVMSIPAQQPTEHGSEGKPHGHGEADSRPATVPSTQNPAMQNHDMGAMPTEKTMPAHDLEASGHQQSDAKAEAEAQDKSKPQDESKPHEHKN